ncbi:unnamed protein product [Musa textilis]
MVELRGLGVSCAYRLGCSLSGCDVVVVRSCPELELEPEWLSFLGWLCGKPVLALGHFPPAAMKHDAAGSFTEGNDFFRWLGKRDERARRTISGLRRTHQGRGTGEQRLGPPDKDPGQPVRGCFHYPLQLEFPGGGPAVRVAARAAAIGKR